MSLIPESYLKEETVGKQQKASPIQEKLMESSRDVQLVVDESPWANLLNLADDLLTEIVLKM